MSNVELKSAESPLPLLPDIPEESWRRTDPELFFLPIDDVRGIDGLTLLSNGSVRGQSLTPSTRVVTAGKVASPLLMGTMGQLVINWISSGDCASRTALLLVSGKEVELLVPESLRDWIRISADQDSRPEAVFPGSHIGRALAGRLRLATGGGLRVDVAARADSEKPVLLVVFCGTSQPQDTALVSLHIARDAQLSLGVLGQDTPWAHRRHNLFVGEGAKVDVAWLHGPSADGSETQVLHERKVFLSKDAEMRDVNVIASRGLVRTVSNVVFVGEGARSESGAALMATRNARVDYEPVQEHRVGRTRSSLRAKVLADDSAHVAFQGLIIVAKEAPRSTALQDNKNLLLGPKARIDASPRLEIFPDDVICKHGSATGELDPRQIYYLMTRGFTEAEARNLIVDAFVADGLAPLGPDHDLYGLCESLLQSAARLPAL